MDNITMDDLPLVERDRVLAIYAACKRIKEASACYGAQQGAIRDAAALCGISSVTMRRWYDIWRNSGDNPLSLVDRRYRKIQARSRVTLRSTWAISTRSSPMLLISCPISCRT